MQNFNALPADLAAAHAMILAEGAARLQAEAQIAGAKLEIERLKLLLARAHREQFGQSSERGRRLIDQLELQLSELEETAAETEVAAEIAAPAADRPSRGEGTRKPIRRPLPEHLPREQILYAAPCTCPKCGGPVRKLGEDVTATLECVPRRWKVVEHVREKVSCRRCEAISQPPAPAHPIARGRAGPHLLALVLAAKYGQHLPLTARARSTPAPPAPPARRWSVPDRIDRSAIERSRSTSAPWPPSGGCRRRLLRRRISRVAADGSVPRPPA